MKQEILAMREMLSNMHQEELSLLDKDEGRRQKVMIERSNLLSILMKLRKARLEATKKLERLTPHLEETLSLETCEILSMRDQLTALIAKMNEQNVRIQNLETDKAPQRYMEPISLKRKSKIKTLLALYPDEKAEE